MHYTLFSSVIEKSEAVSGHLQVPRQSCYYALTYWKRLCDFVMRRFLHDLTLKKSVLAPTVAPASVTKL